MQGFEHPRGPDSGATGDDGHLLLLPGLLPPESPGVVEASDRTAREARTQPEKSLGDGGFRFPFLRLLLQS